MTITEREAIAADGKYLHRVGSNAYFYRCTLFEGETKKDFEEVDEVPKSEEELRIEAMEKETNSVEQLN